MRVFVRWPNDSTLPVRIKPTEKVSALVDLISLAVSPTTSIILTIGNQILDPARTLEELHVSNDSTIFAQFISPFLYLPFDLMSEDDDVDSDVDAQFDSIYKERLRLNDICFNTIEMHRRPQSFYPGLLEEPPLPPAEPVKTELNFEKVLSSEPLPKPWCDDESDEETLPKLGNVREIGEFLARRKCPSWMNLH